MLAVEGVGQEVGEGLCVLEVVFTGAFGLLGRELDRLAGKVDDWLLDSGCGRDSSCCLVLPASCSKYTIAAWCR